MNEYERGARLAREVLADPSLPVVEQIRYAQQRGGDFHAGFNDTLCAKGKP